MFKELKALLKAVKICQEHGCFDDIDCSPDGGAFLYKAINKAERVIADYKNEIKIEVQAERITTLLAENERLTKIFEQMVGCEQSPRKEG